MLNGNKQDLKQAMAFSGPSAVRRQRRRRWRRSDDDARG